MSTDRDVSRIVRSWLKEDAHEDADRLLALVLDQVDTTPQRRATWWPARRITPMNTYTRYGLAAAIVVAAVLLGFTVLRPSIGTEDQSPTPTASPSISATRHVSGEAFPVQLELMLPAAWQAFGDSTGEWVFKRRNLSLTEIGFYVVDNLYVDPCEPQLGRQDPPIGASVDDLAAALISLPAYDGATVTTVELGGHDARHIGLSGAPSGASVACQEAMTSVGTAGRDAVVRQLALGRYPDMWIVDVGGTRLLVIQYGNTNDPELEAILASLQLSPR